MLEKENSNKKPTDEKQGKMPENKDKIDQKIESRENCRELCDTGNVSTSTMQRIVEQCKEISKNNITN